MSLQPNHVYQFGPYCLDSTERRLLRDGEVVALQPKVFDLLLALVARHGRLLEKDELLRVVWPDAEVEEANLSNNISILRRMLGEAGDAGPYIETVPKHGYRFVAEVTKVAGEAAVTPPDASAILPPPTEAEAADTAARSGGDQSSARRRWKLRVGAALGVTLALAAAVGFWLKGRTGQPPPETLAVLPFVNVSADAQAEYLSDGLTESLINRLAQLPGLRVTARDSSFRFKNQNLSAQQVGQKLGVRAVLTGRVAERDGMLAVQVDLLRVADVTPLWVAQYDRPTAEIFALQEEIARNVAAALRLEGETVAKQPRRPVNFAAYQFYLRGRYHYGTLMPEDVRKSVTYFHRAIEIDPTYALAYAGLADAYGALSYHGEIPPQRALARREALVSKALALDDTLAEAHLAMAGLKAASHWDWAGAEREFKRTIELRPDYAAAHAYYSDHLSAMGRFVEAAAEMDLALQSDPVSSIAVIAAVIPFRARRYDEAIARCRQILEIGPEFPGIHSLLGEAYEQQGRYAEAIAAYEQARAKLGGANMLDMLAHAHAVSGNRAEALKLLAELQRVAAREYVSPYDLARVYVGLGDADRAFEYLEKAYAERNSHLRYLKVEPVLDPLRADPRFKDLLRRVGLGVARG
jgi:TolB-like protein/DNA-binding winged helix-turn-helix (wHTH) protein/Tfp pilus assembly protein PilF